MRRPVLGRQAAMCVAAYAFAVAMLSTTLPTPLYPLYQEELGYSHLVVAVVFAIYAVGVIASLLLFGGLSDRIGRRRTLLPGLALAALAALAFLLAHDVTLLLVARLVAGLSAGIFTGTATAALVDLAGPHGRGRATFVATVANMGGLGFGPLLSGLLVQYAGSPLRLSYVVDLVLIAVAAVGVWAIPETVRTPQRFRVRVQRPAVPPEVRAQFVPAALAGFAGFAVLGLFAAVVPAFLRQVMGVHDTVVVGVVVFLVYTTSTLGQAALARVPARHAVTAGCGALLAGMALLALALAVSSIALLVAGGCVATFGQGLSFRAGLSAVTEASPPDRRGAVASSFFVVTYLALALPVVGVGAIATVTGLRTGGLIFTAMVAAVAVVVLVLLRRRQAAAPTR